MVEIAVKNLYYKDSYSLHQKNIMNKAQATISSLITHLLLSQGLTH